MQSKQKFTNLKGKVYLKSVLLNNYLDIDSKKIIKLIYKIYYTRSLLCLK